MTANQITKKLQAAGIDMNAVTISRDEVEVYATNKNGEFSESKTESIVKNICKTLGFGGFRCQHGGWVLQANYETQGDYDDKNSKWHY
jgi:hypothetical protein